MALGIRVETIEINQNKCKDFAHSLAVNTVSMDGSVWPSHVTRLCLLTAGGPRADELRPPQLAANGTFVVL